MCKCTPEIRTPYCGRGNCINPHDKPQGARSQLPQDVEEFIAEKQDYVDNEYGEGAHVIYPNDLRAWMTGHVRVPVESFDLMKEALEMIVTADWRKWEELASPDEFVRWAKSRAHHALSMLNASKGE